MKHLLISLVACLIAFAVNAQTYYYAHTKTVYANGRVENHNGQSGQFIRKASDGQKRCFDCTSTGRDHLNGTLFYIGDYQGSEVYKGSSYFGPNTTYQFNDSKGLLNIKDSKGNVYVYYRRQAPAGRTRSSLIAANGAVDGWSPYDNYVDPITTETTVPSNSNRSKSSTGRTTRSSSSRTCGYCHGGGRVRAHIGTSSFGVTNRKKKCATCGEYYDTATDHWHACPHCKGTGRL